MNSIFADSLYFGFFLTLFAYWLGIIIRQKTKLALCNPLLIATIFIIIVLLSANIDYKTFNQGASYFTYLLTPATVCLALPLYRQLQILKENLLPVIAALFAGAVTCMVLIVGMAYLLKLDHTMAVSLLPKSITTAIAMGVTEELGGMSSITVVAVIITGIFSSVISNVVFRLFHITNPIAEGLALGAAGHAIGTSKALESGEIQGAMASLAIVVTGIMTVVLAPLTASLFF